MVDFTWNIESIVQIVGYGCVAILFLYEFFKNIIHMFRTKHPKDYAKEIQKAKDKAAKESAKLAAKISKLEELQPNQVVTREIIQHETVNEKADVEDDTKRGIY